MQVANYGIEPQEVQPNQQKMTKEEGADPEEEVEDVSQVTEAEEVTSERSCTRYSQSALVKCCSTELLFFDSSLKLEPEPDMKEDSDEDEEDDEESERLRFKTERKDSTVVRLSDAASKRRKIPETLGASHSEPTRLNLLLSTYQAIIKLICFVLFFFC